MSFLGGVGQTRHFSLLTVGNATVAGNVRTTGSQTFGSNLNVTGERFPRGRLVERAGCDEPAQSATVNASTVFFSVVTHRPGVIFPSQARAHHLCFGCRALAALATSR